ncbi:MAG TPA: DUF4097 family beta strand repeat-containing protein [Candidatus Thermoplasmatota archaeon]|nr:DUF4097 family beta strand repeat-containing protein [Candidatus Thermoplasmatota archaeon]
MRPLLATLVLALLAATLSGCASTEPNDLPAEEPSEGFQTDLFEGDPSAGSAVGDARSHGTPERDDGTVESGMEPPLQLPSSWARRTVTITNDFGGADLGTVFAGVDAGSITVVPGEGSTYTVEATIEARGLTEQEARDALDRVEVTHDDVLESDGLHLTTVVKERPAQQALPLLQVGYGNWATVDLVLTLPAGPAYDLTADSSFGEIDVSGLRGPSFLLTVSSGNIVAHEINAGLLAIETSSGDAELTTIRADSLEATLSSGTLTGTEMMVGKAVVDVSSGSIDLEGVFDTLEADSGSGSIGVEAHAMASGAYDLSASSGDIDLRLLTSPVRAYHVMADAGSGEVDVELDDSDTLDEEDDHAEVVSDGFDAAPIKTVVELETGSGSIQVSDRAIGEPAGHDEDEDEDGGEHDHGGGQA